MLPSVKTITERIDRIENNYTCKKETLAQRTFSLINSLEDHMCEVDVDKYPEKYEGYKECLERLDGIWRSFSSSERDSCYPAGLR